MTAAERVARLKLLYEKVAALNEEIAQLEAEDEQYVAFRQRAQVAGRRILGYPDFVRYSGFREQLEAAWQAAGRPRSWDKAEPLVKLRNVLLIPPDPAGPVPPAARSVAPARQPVAAAAAAETAAAPPAAPPRVARVAAPATSAPPGPTAPPAPPSPTAPGRRGRGAAASPVTPSQLIEMHAPILTEVGELTRRAEEEFRMGQTASALTSIERATYLLERVAHAPAAMSERLIKVLDEGLKEGALADADRGRRESVRGRITTVLAAEG